MHALVHCSAGIGRTGTVLFCLICYDHLSNWQRVDIFQVIRNLREDRGRLIENQAQFNLCLRLLDEILFGYISHFPISDMKSKLLDFSDEASESFRRLQRLPNVFSFTTAMENMSENRNLDIVAPDSFRVYIQVIIMITRVLIQNIYDADNKVSDQK